ncbi:hypothetical protein PM082_017845 [Marasmius tenuissimus]|nr:hypothetical protein PM082_017845 [Marasmius tenuissimus]
MAPDIVLAKLYSNSLLVAFNSRIQINNSRGRLQTNDSPSGLISVNSAVLRTRPPETNQRPAEVRVEETTDWNGSYPMDPVKTGTDRSSPDSAHDIETSNV